MSAHEDADRRFSQMKGERDYYRRLAEMRGKERDELAARLEEQRDALRCLIEHSEGVAGLHLNGDLAPWGDLVEGGNLEGWLYPFGEMP